MESEIQNLYKQAKQDFRNYANTQQELPELEIVSGKSSIQEDPKYYRKEPHEEVQNNVDVKRNPLEKQNGKEESKEWDLLHDPFVDSIEFYGRTGKPRRFQHLIPPDGFETWIDRENYSIQIGEKDYQNIDEEQLYDLMLAGIKTHANSALEEAFQPIKEKIESQYSHLNPDIDVDSFYFSKFGDNGGYSGMTNELSLELAHLDDFDLKKGFIKSEAAESLVYHEGIHALQYHLNPFFQRFDDATIEHVKEYGTGIHKHNSKAPGEMAASFEEFRENPEIVEDKYSERAELGKAWEEGPEALKEYAEQNSEEIKENPYRLGQFTASIVNHALEKISDTPMEDTREFMMYSVTVPNGYIGMIESAFDILGMEAPEEVSNLEPYFERIEQ